MSDDGAENPVLKRLKLRDPRDFAELLVPGLRSRPDDDPIRRELALYSAGDIQAAVQATKDALPVFRRRVPNGCLLCTRELEDVQVLKDEFASRSAKSKRQARKKVGAKPKRAKLSLAQQRFLASRFYTEDDEFVTLCVMHQMMTFDVGEKTLVTMMRSKRSGKLWKDEDKDNEVEEEEEEEEELTYAQLTAAFDRVGE